MNHETWRKINKNDITPSEDKVERIVNGKHDDEWLSSNKNLDEDFKDELKHDEPTMKTPVKKALEVKDERIRFKACDELDWALKMIIEITWSSGNQYEQVRIKDMIWWTSSRQKN